MDLTYYLTYFQQAVDQLDKRLLDKKRIKVSVDIYVESVCIKLYKVAWANEPQAPLTVGPRIFFSIWVYDASIKENKLYYNIHALQLRQLNGYSIKSRDFAAAFRAKFRPFENEWPNVSVAFGPLTLMQGWKEIDVTSFQDELLALCNQFLTLDHLIDELLDNYKKTNT